MDVEFLEALLAVTALMGGVTTAFRRGGNPTPTQLRSEGEAGCVLRRRLAPRAGFTGPAQASLCRLRVFYHSFFM